MKQQLLLIGCTTTSLALLYTLSTRKMVLGQSLKLLYTSVGGVIKAPYNLATIAKRREKWKAEYACPVAGIDALQGQQILFCLQRSVLDAKDEDVPGLWLQALHIAQVLSDRLLQDLADVEKHLLWWSNQFAQGTSHWHHFRFMLLGRGPISFVMDMSRLIMGVTKPLRRAVRAVRSTPLRRRRNRGMRLAGRRLPVESVMESNLEDQGSDEEDETETETVSSHNGRMSATDKMQQRMLILQSIRTILAEAVAQVHVTGLSLRLGTNIGGSASGVSNPLAPNASAMLRDPMSAQSRDQGPPASALTSSSPFATAAAAAQALDRSPGNGDAPDLIAAARQVVEAAVADMQSVVTELDSQVCQLTSDGSSKVQLNRAYSPPCHQPLPSFSSRGQPVANTASTSSASHAEGGAQHSTTENEAVAFISRPRLPREESPSPSSSPQQQQQQQHRHHPRYERHASHPRTIAEESEDNDGEDGGEHDDLRLLMGPEERSAQVQGTLQHLQFLLSANPPGALSSSSLSKRPQPDTLIPTSAAGQSYSNMYPSSPDRASSALPRSLSAANRGERGVNRAGSGLKLQQLPTAKQVLDSAKRQAALSGHLVVIPQWANRPSRLQRHWMRFMLGSALLTYSSYVVFKHSSLAGSDDIQRWANKAVQATTNSWKAHVLQPLLTVRDELTRTFRDRPSIVSPEEFDADKQSLLRMLSDFQADVPGSVLPTAAASSSDSKPSGSSSSTSNAAGSGGSKQPSSSSSSASAGVKVAEGSGGVTEGGESVQGEGKAVVGGSSAGDLIAFSPEDQDALIAGMKDVMSSYEFEMRHPVKNMLMGQLVRSLLIQVQRLKLDTEAAMLELDQILRANELSISLVAAVPALAISWGLLVGLYRWLQPRAPDIKRAAVPSRMALVDLERALAHALEIEEAEARAGAASLPAFGRIGSLRESTPNPFIGAQAISGGATNPMVSEAHGMVLYQVHRVHQEAMELFCSADRTSRFSEWPALSADLVQLAGAGSTAQRARVHERMSHSYKVFQR